MSDLKMLAGDRKKDYCRACKKRAVIFRRSCCWLCVATGDADRVPPPDRADPAKPATKDPTYTPRVYICHVPN